MGRRTVTLNEDAEAIIEEKVEDSDVYESVSAFVRDCVKSYERAEDLQARVDDLEADLEDRREEIERLEERADRVDDLETTVERLRNEKQTLLEQREEHAQLQRYVEEERMYRNAGLRTRLKWWMFGKPSESSA